MSEYIKKEDTLKALHDFWDEYIGYDGSGTEMMLDNESVINNLPTYSFPDSAENKTNEEIIKAMFPNGYELDIKKHQYVAWVAKNKTDFSFEVSENFWKAKHEGSCPVTSDSAENKGEDSKVAKGQWIKFENGYKCSECGHIMDKVLSVSGNLIYQYSNYCPECGKKMSLEEPTEEEVQAFWLEAINSRCM